MIYFCKTPDIKVKVNHHGMVVPIIIVVIVFIALLGYGIYQYTSFEKNLVARIQNASVAEKLSQAAVYEMANLLNYKIINFKNLDDKNDLDRFVLAPVSEHKIDNLTFYMSGKDLRAFDLAAELGAKLEYVELKYERFRKYFNDTQEPENYSKSCYVPSDPFERYGGIIISAKVSYKTSVRIFCSRHEIKTSQTILPVLSKFTLFMKDSDEKDQNALKMSCPVPEKEYTEIAADLPDTAGDTQSETTGKTGSVKKKGLNMMAFDPFFAMLTMNNKNADANLISELMKKKKNPVTTNSTQIRRNRTQLSNPNFGKGAWPNNARRLEVLKSDESYLESNRGLLDFGVKHLRVPIIFIHHPDDMAAVSGYGETHAEIREYLPMDERIAAKGVGNNISYRPSITNRGWVFLGSEDPEKIYFHNVSPGKINPPRGTQPEPDKDHSFFGNAFMIKEYGIPISARMCRDSKIPYQYAFSDFNPPGNLDFILRLTQTGIYWIYKDTALDNILGNFYQKHPEMSANSSLLQISGDMQVSSYSGDAPSKYIDRRSPTLVLGKVFRFYMQVGQITQNCVHPPSSPFFNEMMPNGLHNFPYPLDGHFHPQSRWIPYFDMGKDGNAIDNPEVDITSRDWNGTSAVNDELLDDYRTPVPGNVDFKKIAYNFNHDLFKCYDNQHNQVYKFFMTKPICEVYNKSYDAIVSNAGPAGGIFKPNEMYSMTQDKVKIISSYPDSQLDSRFFYGEEGGYGSCVYGNNLKISQYSSRRSGGFEEDASIYPGGVFRGALQSVQLTSGEYTNPMKADAQIDTSRYDIRYKADFTFDNYGEFESLFTKKADGGGTEFKNGGVFYIDSDQTVDLTKGKSVPKLLFHDNTMLICKKDVRVPSIYKSAFARETGSTLTVVSVEGDVIIAGEEIEASLNSLNGTIKKEVEYFQVLGNMTMKKMSFDYERAGNLFKVSGVPKGKNFRMLGSDGLSGYQRLSVVYDPALDPCNVENYKKHYNYILSSRQTFWRVTTE